LSLDLVGGQRLRIFDSPPVHAFTFTPAISFFLDCESEEQLRDLAAALGEDGGFLMPVGSYGFSQLFAWVNDRFGVSWQLNLA
jgi:predicted 3-demethylubiquinone-9 3-methyltransferase (glyoxalase superfamily)